MTRKAFQKPAKRRVDDGAIGHRLLALAIIHQATLDAESGSLEAMEWLERDAPDWMAALGYPADLTAVIQRTRARFEKSLAKRQRNGDQFYLPGLSVEAVVKS